MPAAVGVAVPAVEPAPGQEAPFFVWLGAHGGDSRRGELRFAAARREGDHAIVPGAILLVSSQRSLYFGLQVGSAGKALFFTVQLPRALDPAQSPWSDWHSFAADPAAPAQTGPDGFAVRYRIAFAPEA